MSLYLLQYDIGQINHAFVSINNITNIQSILISGNFQSTNFLGLKECAGCKLFQPRCTFYFGFEYQSSIFGRFWWPVLLVLRSFHEFYHRFCVMFLKDAQMLSTIYDGDFLARTEELPCHLQ